MGQYDIEGKERVEVIRVEQILRRYRKLNGSSATEILDQQGRHHLLSAVDLSQPGFDSIEVGSVLGIKLKEKVVEARVLDLGKATDIEMVEFIESLIA